MMAAEYENGNVQYVNENYFRGNDLIPLLVQERHECPGGADSAVDCVLLPPDYATVAAADSAAVNRPCFPVSKRITICCEKKQEILPVMICAVDGLSAV